jgi:hypothetical protein
MHILIIMLHTDRTNGNPSSVLNSVPPLSGDGSNLGHYGAEIVTPELRVVSACGGRAFNLFGDQPPRLVGMIDIIVNVHLRGGPVSYNPSASMGRISLLSRCL